MAVLFSMPTTSAGEVAYDFMTKVTGSGQSQAWNGTGVTFTVANTNNVYASKEGLDFSTATALRVTGIIDASGMTFTGNALFGVCVVSLPLTGSGDHRVGMSYQYTHAGTVHQLFFQKVDDGGATARNDAFVITPGPHTFDIVLTKASSAIASDGTSDYYIDGALVGGRTGLDIYDDFEDLEWLQIGNAGKMSGLDATATGPFTLSAIAINDTGDPITFPMDRSLFHASLSRRRRKT